MRKFKIYLIVATLLVGFLAGCTKNFEEINSNPNSPTTLESGLLLAGIISSAQNTSYSTFVGGDMGSNWVQHWSKVEYTDEERYQPRSSIIGMIWDNFYEDVISDANTMQELAKTEGNKNVQGVALVLKAYGYLYLTDIYGSIPFSEALQAEQGNFSPKYDTQEDVYTGVLVMLDSANLLLTSDGGTINANSDILYGGDYSKWKKFANSLKFRALMRISSKKDVKAQLQALVDAGNMFASNSDEAKLNYLDAYPNANPIYESVVHGNRGEYKVNDKLVTTLQDMNDPRLAVYCQKNTDGEYVGKPSGPKDQKKYWYDGVSSIGTSYLAATAPAYFMSYAQLQFLMAEAVLKGYITGTAQTYYTNGITASMSANSISDWSGMSGTTLSTTSADALKQVYTQEWLALFDQGMEAWAEWRRTGSPTLTPATDGYISEIPSRLFYPATEQSLNAANYQSAVAAQGEDILTTKVWWMTN